MLTVSMAVPRKLVVDILVLQVSKEKGGYGKRRWKRHEEALEINPPPTAREVVLQAGTCMDSLTEKGPEGSTRKMCSTRSEELRRVCRALRIPGKGGQDGADQLHFEWSASLQLLRINLDPILSRLSSKKSTETLLDMNSITAESEPFHFQAKQRLSWWPITPCGNSSDLKRRRDLLQYLQNRTTLASTIEESTHVPSIPTEPEANTGSTHRMLSLPLLRLPSRPLAPQVASRLLRIHHLFQAASWKGSDRNPTSSLYSTINRKSRKGAVGLGIGKSGAQAGTISLADPSPIQETRKSMLSHRTGPSKDSEQPPNDEEQEKLQQGEGYPVDASWGSVGDGRDVGGGDRGSASQEGCRDHSEERPDQPARCHPQRGSWHNTTSCSSCGDKILHETWAIEDLIDKVSPDTNTSTNSTGEAISTAKSSTVSRRGFGSLNLAKPRSYVGLLMLSLNLLPMPSTPGPPSWQFLLAGASHGSLRAYMMETSFETCPNSGSFCL
ncbi:hypothetical protein BKA70DRAFT_1216687 [Coprinopsis sp. MPI-PUGE-AT-0042]|nr:hypothetical protein BKA70DRAFT_1216687 [Coprinopsis sp. MPI-PUGE-AT-0042]